MGSLIPKGVHWIKAAVAAFEPKDNAVILDGCRVVNYKRLIVCAGAEARLEHGSRGWSDTLGHNGVTSNYRYDLAPYTWELVQGLKAGRARVHAAADAHQMRGRAAKGDVSLGRRTGCATGRWRTSTSSS